MITVSTRFEEIFTLMALPLIQLQKYIKLQLSSFMTQLLVCSSAHVTLVLHRQALLDKGPQI